MNTSPFSRRRLLQTGAAGAAALALSRSSAFAFAKPSAQDIARKAANAKVRFAFIGTGPKGLDNLGDFKNEVGITPVAVCDVDEKYLADAADLAGPDARTYGDFREMLAKEANNIDVVVVSTPDHNHAVCALEAMKHGKAVYCEKPLSHDIWEARTLAEAARHFKVPTQMGNQGHSSGGLRQQVDWIRAGVIGDVREVHVSTDRPNWPQGAGRFAKKDLPQPPKGMNWDMWLGSRPVRPFAMSDITNPKTKRVENVGTYHPGRWRGWLDFGNGALGDMAPHLMDAAFWALNLTGDCAVTIECEGVNDQTYPTWSIVTWHFPARPGIRDGKEVELAPVKVSWYEGGKFPKRPDGVTEKEWTAKNGENMKAAVFVGERGVMFGDYTGKPKLAEAARKDFTPPTRQPWFLPGGPGHHQEIIDAAVSSGAPAPMANFDYASKFTETILLGTIAQRVGKRIEWDSKAMKITNRPEANRFVKPDRRPGWEMSWT
jgi:predicted dehydrogenase